MSKFEPILAAKIYSGDAAKTAKNWSLIRYPVLVSVKWDGWRMFDRDGKATCRSLKPPKNRHVQKTLADFYKRARELAYIGADGEILCGDPYHHNVMQATSSGCNSYDGQPEFVYQLFDIMGDPNSNWHRQTFTDRIQHVQEMVGHLQPEFPFLRHTEHWLVHNETELLEALDKVVALGGEGLMGRDPDGPYKFGRSTMKEGILWALKPYADDEAEIIGFAEELENQNELQRDERGYAKRSGHQENLVPKGRLGKFICRSPNFPETFSVGAGVGLTHQLRQQVWDNQDLYLGRHLKYKYQEIGVKERPRQPKFMGFREAEDMG